MKPEKLELVYIKSEQLHLLPENPRKLRDPEGIRKLKTLIDKHGFQNPLQTYQEKDGSYSILCGNHRFMAAKELGYTEFPCIIYKGDRKRALARAVGDNKASEWTEWSYPELASLLVEIDTGDFELPDLTGFQLEEISMLIHGPDFKPIENKQEKNNKTLIILSPETETQKASSINFAIQNKIEYHIQETSI